MKITAALVKELRERTGAGMMECKKALTEHGGDIEASIEAMRIAGQAQAAKKAGRIAAEGLLAEGQKVLALIVEKGDEGHILTATSNGYGKRTPIADYPLKTNRGGMGVIAIKTSKRNGDLVSATQVTDDDDVMLISDRGTLVRTPVNGVTSVGRNAQGVTLINLSKGEQLVGIERIVELHSDDDVEQKDTDETVVATEQGLPDNDEE